MNDIVSLKRKYPSVKINDSLITHGGNQAYFELPGDKKSAYRRAKGCGMIAIHDVYQYLSNKDVDFTSPGQYRRSVNSLAKHIGWIPTPSGTKNIFIIYAINRILRELHLKRHARWCISIKKIESRVREMLKNDLPVIMCIPFMLLPQDKKHNLQMYTFNTLHQKMLPTHSTNAHFVTITGIVEHNQKLYYRISSWGLMLYIDIEECNAFMRNHFLGFYLGNILYIK